MSQMEIIRRQIGAASNMFLLIVWFFMGKMVGENAVTYLVVAFGLSYLFVTIVCGGVPDTVGRMLRSRRNKSQFKNVTRIKQSVLLLQLVFGVVFALILFGLAGVLCRNVMQMEYCTILVRVMSLFVLIRAFSCMMSGFLQGEGFELLSSAVGVLRPVLIWWFSRLFVGKLQEYGTKVSNLLLDENFSAMYAALGVVIAVCVAELLCLVFLLVIYKGCMILNKKERQESLRTMDSFATCAMGLVNGRFPLWISAFVSVFAVLLGAFIWKRVAPTEVDFIGIYSSYVQNCWLICGILVAVVFILSVSVLGKTFEFIRKEDKRFARITFQGGVHISVVHGIFCAVIVAVMAGQIVGMLAPVHADTVLWMLRMGSVAIVPGAVCCFYSRFLIAAGRKLQVMGAYVLSVIIYTVINLIVFFLGKWSEKMLIFSGILLLIVLWIVLGSLAYRLMRARVDWVRVLVVPMGAGCVVGLLGMLLGKLFTPHLGNAMTLLVTSLLGIFVYWMILLLFRNFKEQELDVILGGKLMYALGQVFRVY